MDEKAFYKDLLHRVKWEKNATTAEIEAVAKRLQATPDDTNAKTLLEIIRWTFDLSYRTLVERFLDHDQLNLAEMALNTLCFYWHLTPGYKDQVLRFLGGVEGDVENECRSLAVKIAGQYLLEHHEPAFLRELIDIYEDKRARMSVDAEYVRSHSQDEDPFLVAWEIYEAKLLAIEAYYALAYAVGRDVPGPVWSVSYDLDLERNTDPDILHLAKERLSRELTSNLDED